MSCPTGFGRMCGGKVMFRKIWSKLAGLYGEKRPRQNWKPHWSMRALQRIWIILFSVFKIAAGAAVTVLLVGVVCGFVFMGVVGDYLQEDILPMAGMVIEDVEMDQSSTMYYVDSAGDIQVYQNIFY